MLTLFKYTSGWNLWLKDNLDKPELLFPDASLHYLVHSASSDDSDFLSPRDAAWVFVYTRHTNPLGNYRRWSTLTCFLCSDITWQLLCVCCQQPGQLLSVLAHQEERIVSTQGRTTLTPVFYHHLTAHLSYRYFATSSHLQFPQYQ